MVHWNLWDDQRYFHHTAIHDATLVQDLPHALLSPQHWSQQANNHFPCSHGTCMQQLSNKWQQQQFVKMIPLDPKYNTQRFYLSFPLFMVMMPSNAVTPWSMLLSSSLSQMTRPLPLWTIPRQNCCIAIIKWITLVLESSRPSQQMTSCQGDWWVQISPNVHHAFLGSCTKGFGVLICR